MKIVDVKHLKSAKKYSNALFQSASEVGLEEKVYDDIVFISETVNTNVQLKNVLVNPIVTIEDKKDIVKKLFSIHIEKITLDFIYLLLENSRFDELNEIVNYYNRNENIRNNIISPIITSAIELSNEQKSRITAKLEEKTGKKIKAEYIVNSKIIGGIIIEIDDKTIDLSIKNKFDNMKKQLTKGSNYGNN